MPLYEYQCQKCSHRFERIQKFSDPPVKKCPECGGKVEQLVSAPAVQFKGSGWYVTDYAKKPGARVRVRIPAPNPTLKKNRATAKGLKRARIRNRKQSLRPRSRKRTSLFPHSHTDHVHRFACVHACSCLKSESLPASTSSILASGATWS
jgi:putative FmdB family regulatory protein